MRMGTCRTKECAPAPVVLTGTAVGTDVGLQLSTTGKLEAVGEGEPVGVGEGPGLGDEPVVEPAAETVGCGTPLLAGIGELVWLLGLEVLGLELLGFESPQAAATRRAAMQRAAMAARRKPRIMSSTPPGWIPVQRLCNSGALPGSSDGRQWHVVARPISGVCPESP
jgi:hypothetical protein